VYRWCEAWPQEVKEAEKRLYRANCRVRCLEAALDRCDPEDFDDLMAQIEEAQEEVWKASYARVLLRPREFENK